MIQQDENGILSLQDEQPGEREGLNAHYQKVGENAWVQLPTKVRWVNDYICFLTEPDSDLEGYLDQFLDRTPGKLEWRVREKGFVASMMSFATSVTSGTLKPDAPADASIIEARKASCLSCPLMVRDARGSMFCNGCRCGRWQLADLDGAWLPKLGWRHLDCPMRRDGFSNAK